MRNKILVAALVVVGLASVAYAAFAQILTIGGTGTATGSWDVKITGITPTAATGATDATAPSYTGTSATFSTNLAYPGATATYQVTVKNNGNTPAKLSSLTDPSTINGTAPTYITYTLSGVTAGTTTLDPGATNTLTVVVTWDSASSPVTSGETKTATFTLNYVQNT